jgi:predicted ATPase/DNA-binding SARP family transcriptional activator
VRLLGSVQVVDNAGESSRVGGSRISAVFAMLALRAGSLVTTDQLIDGVWGEDAPPTARNALQVHASALRKLMSAVELVAAGPSVEGTSFGYLLHVAPDCIDAFVAERMLTNARLYLASGQAEAAGELAAEALALWSGPELVGLGDAPFADVERTRLRQVRLDLMELTAEVLMSTGRHSEVVRVAEETLVEQPFHEGWWHRLVLALHHSGRTADALAAYERAAFCLREELGLDPGSDLTDLQRMLLRGELPVAVQQSASLTGSRTRSRLPDPGTPLIGRDGEVAELVGLLTTPGVRLVTLTGPGGTGKTRLAISVAQAVAEAYSDGAFFVALAAVTSPEVMWTSIGEALNVPPESRTSAGLLGHLEGRAVLLVLDNLEQLAGADAVVSDLLRAAPGVTVIATSRRPLHLSTEHEHAVPPLQLPRRNTLREAESSGAVSLFVHQARRVKSTFALTDANVADVVHLCARLDGLPLAIELAAARSKVLSPAALVKRLDQVLALQDTGVDRPLRQQTLRTTIAWSYDLLSPVQQGFFRRLGVFVGGAGMEAIEAVTVDCLAKADAFDLVADLVDASLITVTDGIGGEPRIATLQTIGGFARELLRSEGEDDRTDLLFAQHFTTLFQSVADQMTGAGDLVIAARRLFEVEHDNVRALLEWSLGADASASRGAERVRTGQAFCADLWRLWTDGGHIVEGRSWAERAVAKSPDPDSIVLMRCLTMLAEFALLQNEFARGRDMAARAVAMGRRLGDQEGLAGALTILGRCEHNLRNVDMARAVFDETITLAGLIPDQQRLLAAALGALAYMEMGEGRYERSLELQAAALEISGELADERKTLYARQNIACTLRLMGRLSEAQSTMREQFTPVLRMAHSDLLVILAEDYAALLAELGELPRAVRLLGAADALRDRIEMPRLPQQQEEISQPFSRARAEMSLFDWELANSTGRSMTIEDALTEAYQDGPR